MVSDKVNLLQVANRALLAAGHNVTNSRDSTRPTTPGGTMDGTSTAETSLDDDALCDWQLDFEGLELYESNNQLSRKLIKYSRQLKGWG